MKMVGSRGGQGIFSNLVLSFYSKKIEDQKKILPSDSNTVGIVIFLTELKFSMILTQIGVTQVYCGKIILAMWV